MTTQGHDLATRHMLHLVLVKPDENLSDELVPAVLLVDRFQPIVGFAIWIKDSVIRSIAQPRAFSNGVTLLIKKGKSFTKAFIGPFSSILPF